MKPNCKYCPLPIAHCPLPIAHCPLPIAHCPLPIAHCPLPIAHCPLPIAALRIAHCGRRATPSHSGANGAVTHSDQVGGLRISLRVDTRGLMAKGDESRSATVKEMPLDVLADLPVGYLLVNAEGLITRANRAVAGIFECRVAGRG